VVVVPVTDDPRLCIVCHQRELRDDEPQTCRRCVTAVRQAVTEVAVLFPLLTVELHSRVGAAAAGAGRGGDEHPIPFGDLLSLIGPGASTTCGPDAQPDDAPSVVATLASWEDDWRQLRGIAAATCKATVESCAAFLRDQHGWAAQNHPAFDEYGADARMLRGRVRAALRLTDTPVVMGADCFGCGGTLVRDYAAPSPCSHKGPHSSWCDQGGLRDWCRCVSCGREYTPAQYHLALRAAIEASEEVKVA
jgi:hypothetical protein